MGVVFLPSLVTGFSAMSRRQMMTFIDGRQGSANSSQRAACFGLDCRLIRRTTCLVSAIPVSFRRIITSRSRWNLRNIHRLVAELNVVIDPFCAGGLQPVGVVAIRKIGFVVRAKRFLAVKRAGGDHT